MKNIHRIEKGRKIINQVKLKKKPGIEIKQGGLFYTICILMIIFLDKTVDAKDFKRLKLVFL